MKLTEEEGQKLISIARGVLKAAFGECELRIPFELREKLAQPAGVFVTLYKHGQLRGCIGFPEPILPLGVALLHAARAAAFEDPRFPPLSKEELTEIEIEISVLSPPEKINAKPGEQPKHIRVPQDGIVVKKGERSGLLLPQVAKEFGWDAKEFLTQTCIKAGLSPTCWKNENIDIFKFQAQIFREKKIKDKGSL